VRLEFVTAAGRRRLAKLPHGTRPKELGGYPVRSAPEWPGMGARSCLHIVPPPDHRVPLTPVQASHAGSQIQPPLRRRGSSLRPHVVHGASAPALSPSR